MKRLALCLLCVCAVHLPVAAHVLDQYLQVAQIALAPDGVRIKLRLTPGVQIADRVIALIDASGDGQISLSEEQEYAQRMHQDISLEMDGQRITLVLVNIQFPTRREMDEGVGAIRLTLEAKATLDTAGEHSLSFRNDHLPELGAYLVNAMIPATNAIKITGQQRDTSQHELRVNFRVLPTGGGSWHRWAIVLLFGLCLTLFLPYWKRLRVLWRRFEDEQIKAKKTFS